MVQQVRSFTFANVQCLEESDRDYVRERIQGWFGGIPQFEEYLQTILAQHVEELLDQQGPIPFRLVVFGSLPQYMAGMSYLINGVMDGRAPGLLNNSMAHVGVVTASAIAIGIIMRLADTSFADHATGKSFLERQVIGPVTTAVIFSLMYAVALGFVSPAAPAWLAVPFVTIWVMLTCILYLPRRIRGQLPPRLHLASMGSRTGSDALANSENDNNHEHWGDSRCQSAISPWDVEIPNHPDADQVVLI